MIINKFIQNHFSIATLGATIINFLLILFVAQCGIKKELYKRFCFYAGSICLWSFFLFLHVVTENESLAYFFCQTLHVFAMVLPVFFIHFIYEMLNVKDKSKNIILILNYSLALFFSCVSIFQPHLLYPALKARSFSLYYLTASDLYTGWMWIFFLQVIIGHFILARQMCSAAGVRKTQLQFFLIANALGYLGGIGDFLPVYDRYYFPFPYGNYGVILFSIVTAYTILKYNFLSTDKLFKNALVFTGLLGFVFGTFSLASVLFQYFIRHVLNVNEIWSNLLSILIIVLGYDPIRSFLINLTDKYLFQKGYDYHKVLKDASRGMAKIESLKHLLGLVLHFITMKMRVENVAVLSFEYSDRLFRLVAARGYKGNVSRVSLNTDHPLMVMLRETRDAIPLHDITEKLESIEEPEAKSDLKIISDEMRMLGAKCAIPSFLGNDLKNVLLIGDKKSGEPLTSEDISLLMTLAQEASIALENARLYDEAIKKQRQLGQINDQLEHSKKMLVNALSEAEGANKALQDTQAQLIHEQKMATLGRLAASVGHEVNNPLTILSMNVSRAILKFRKNPELKVSEILDVFDKMEKNIERIKAVVNTLTGLLKKSEKGKFEPLSLKLILEETLPLVQFQTYMDNLTGTEVELNVPGSVPLIRGDLERLQEIFLNLFINAYHAMANKRFRKIRVDAENDPETPGMVAVHFTDNGSGMSEDTMKKVFNYGYTTKPPGKGSGLGLYMCKYIVELHGGTIRVKSKLSEGTTFTVTLPVYQEEQTAASASLKAG